MFFVPHRCLSLFPPLSRPLLSAPVLFHPLSCFLSPHFPVALWPLRPGVLKDLKTMGSISLFIFFITLLVLARQVSWNFDPTSPFLSSKCSFPPRPSSFTFFCSLLIFYWLRTCVPKASILWNDSTTFYFSHFHIRYSMSQKRRMAMNFWRLSGDVYVLAAPIRHLDGSYFCRADTPSWGSKALPVAAREASWHQFVWCLFSCPGQCFVSSSEFLEGELYERKWTDSGHSGWPVCADCRPSAGTLCCCSAFLSFF